MTFTVNFNKPEIKTAFEWQLAQEINVLNDSGEVVAKAEIELVTLNKHRDALTSLASMQQQESSDWELPFHLYFSKQNLSADLCQQLNVKISTKAQQHILLEAISVKPEFRNQGVAKLLLEAIANQYPKVQSINTLAMPLAQFVDAEDCESEAHRAYYQALDIDQDQTSADDLKQFFTKVGFVEIELDQSALADPLPFTLFVASPSSLSLQASSN